MGYKGGSLFSVHNRERSQEVIDVTIDKGVWTITCKNPMANAYEIFKRGDNVVYLLPNVVQKSLIITSQLGSCKFTCTEL